MKTYFRLRCAACSKIKSEDKGFFIPWFRKSALNKSTVAFFCGHCARLRRSGETGRTLAERISNEKRD